MNAIKALDLVLTPHQRLGKWNRGGVQNSDWEPITIDLCGSNLVQLNCEILTASVTTDCASWIPYLLGSYYPIIRIRGTGLVPTRFGLIAGDGVPGLIHGRRNLHKDALRFAHQR